MESNTLSLLNRTLEILSQSQDISKLSSTHSLSTYQSFISTPLNTCFSPSHAIYRNFISQITCQNCLNHRCDFALKCSHHFCLRCIKSTTRILNEPISTLYEDDSSPKCPICSEPITRIQAEEILTYAKTNNELQQQESYKKCLICHMLRPKSKFFYACHDICLFCGFHSKINQSCSVCGESRLNPNVLEYSHIECKSCKKNIVIADDYATEICNEEFHCFDCLKIAWSKGKCKICESPLSIDTINYLKELIFVKCEACENVVDRKFLVEKICCKSNLCLFCQKLIGNACGKCNCPLLQSTLMTLNMLPELD